MAARAIVSGAGGSSGRRSDGHREIQRPMHAHSRATALASGHIGQRLVLRTIMQHSLLAYLLPLCTSDSRSSRSAKSWPSSAVSRPACVSIVGLVVVARRGSLVAPPEGAACEQH